MKTLFRRHFKKQLSLLSIQQVQSESQSILQTILRDPFFQSCTHLCCYVPMLSGHEVDTTPLIQHVLSTSNSSNRPQLYVPIVGLDDRMEMVLVPDEQDFASFEIRNEKYKLLEPPIESLPHRKNLMDSLDPSSRLLVIVPGLAFDFKKNRLGRGKGHYDQFFDRLHALREEKQFETLYASVCFKCQFMDESYEFPQEMSKELDKYSSQKVDGKWVIPTEKHDVVMDKVLTFDRVVV